MGAMKFHGPVLPDGTVRDLWVVDGLVTYEPQAGADVVASGWIVPGLVDAHCHLGLVESGAATFEQTEADALADRDAGALLVRDCGSAADTRWIHEREDLPRLIRAGRHVARSRRYIRNYAAEVEPDTLAAEVAEQARAGDGWVKLVGDWISRETGDLEPSFTPAEFASAIEAAHAEGAQVTAHCFGTEVLAGLIDAGIDCIEHGTGLTSDLIESMVARDVALVPTVMQTELFPTHAAIGAEKFPAYAATMNELYLHRREVLMNAHEAGVRLYAGSDHGGDLRHGNLPGEVLAMARMGLSNSEALGAASWNARAWLGFNPTLGEGDLADFVVYPRDPIADLSVLREPSAIVLRGRVVA